MAKFVPGTDTSVQSTEPNLEIVVTPQARLAVGKHVFQLAVTDDSGNESAPAQITIIVQDPDRPTAIIDFVDAGGRVNPAPEVRVATGQKFSLTGARSFDVGGSVRTWRWTLLKA